MADSAVGTVRPPRCIWPAETKEIAPHIPGIRQIPAQWTDIFPIRLQVRRGRECLYLPRGQTADHARERSSVTTCPFRKFHPAQIRIVRQNHRIIESDDCNPTRTRNVRHRPVQVAEPA
jgi:hypothetical protein